MNVGQMKVWAKPPMLDAFLFSNGMTDQSGDSAHLNAWLEARDGDVYSVGDYDGHAEAVWVIQPNDPDLYVFPGDLVIFEGGKFRRESGTGYLVAPHDLELPFYY